MYSASEAISSHVWNYFIKKSHRQPPATIDLCTISLEIVDCRQWTRTAGARQGLENRAVSAIEDTN